MKRLSENQGLAAEASPGGSKVAPRFAQRLLKYAKNGFFAVLSGLAVAAHRTDLLVMVVFTWGVLDLILVLAKHGVNVRAEAFSVREPSGWYRKVVGVMCLLFAVGGVFAGVRKSDLVVVVGAISLFGVGGLVFLLTEPKSMSSTIRSRYRLARKLGAPKRHSIPPNA
jgi:hypothetical protein